MVSRFRPARLFRNESGAFDLPSVLIGVAVVAILAVGVMALIFGAVPWAQNRAAAQDLAALTTAQGTAKVQDGGYVDPTRMSQLGYLSDDAGLDYSIAADESCWVGVTKAKSGKHFYTVNGSAPAELTRETSPGCLGKELRYEQISAGDNGACGIASGALYCWGANSNGQIGDGTTAPKTRPVKVGGALAGKTVVEIYATATHRCAIVAGGQLYCWGYGAGGEIGDGGTSDVMAPVAVRGLLDGKKVTSAAVGEHGTCAVSEQKLYCWGEGVGVGTKTLGDDARSTGSPLPVHVDGGALKGVPVADITDGTNHACALAVAGQAYCWGYGGNGQIGNGTVTASNPVPVAVTMSTVTGGAFKSISAGSSTVCAVGSGTVYCWGWGADGQTGNGAVAIQRTPQPVGGSAIAGRTMEQVSLGRMQGCAGDDASTWLCWGANGSGTLATGDRKPVLYPAEIARASAAPGIAPSGVSVGPTQTCALISADAFCTGLNTAGGLGNGNTTDALVFLKVLEPLVGQSWVDSVLNGGKLP